ncbi:MAG TPA: PQQ-binding-like beta-propeller repeat protein, partial [Gemmataceae bacterium]|jgi:outer membrane protein assembly factor BamB|nr:PQQ-binding-like beta-propeller repeat protein [Gemmataceae bacterium]
LTDGGSPEVAWRSTRLGCGTPTPLIADGRVYCLKDGGTIICGRLDTGKEIWTQRLRGTFSASPVLADGKLYVANEGGETTVLRTGDRPAKVSVNSLGGPMLATPAISGGRLFLRSESWLYCVGR